MLAEGIKSMEQKEKIEETRKYIEEYQIGFKALDELQHAVEGHTGKLIDKRFFEKHFYEKDEEWEKYRNEKRTKYSMSTPDYGYGGTTHVIYLGVSHYKLELKSRETAHILEVIVEQVARYEEIVISYNKTLAQLEALDVDAIVKDIRAVYDKYKANIPQYFWQDIIELYNVKCPDKD